MTAYEWRRDPKRLTFILARYKHVAKLLEGRSAVLEVGCADGFGSRIVRQHVGSLIAVDKDPEAIAQAAKSSDCAEWPIEFRVYDMLQGPYRSAKFDAVYALDVLEHMDSMTEEEPFLEALRASADVAVIGMPSLESQVYASELSRLGHVNCKTGPGLLLALRGYWRHVFLFGINDETLHTGFAPMVQYRLALAIG